MEFSLTHLMMCGVFLLSLSALQMYQIPVLAQQNQLLYRKTAIASPQEVSLIRLAESSLCPIHIYTVNS